MRAEYVRELRSTAAPDRLQTCTCAVLEADTRTVAKMPSGNAVPLTPRARWSPSAAPVKVNVFDKQAPSGMDAKSMALEAVVPFDQAAAPLTVVKTCPLEPGAICVGEKVTVGVGTGDERISYSLVCDGETVHVSGGRLPLRGA